MVLWNSYAIYLLYILCNYDPPNSSSAPPGALCMPSLTLSEHLDGEDTSSLEKGLFKVGQVQVLSLKVRPHPQAT